MSPSNSEPQRVAGSTSPNSFSAQSHMGLAEVLQMCCLSRRSGQITFRSGESYGYVFVQQGRVLHAMCGVVEGEEAIYLMLSWPAGSFTLDEDILPHKRTISASWEQLLFEGAHRSDLGGGPKTPSVPVITADPLTSSRSTKDNQPKVIITRPDGPQMTFELETEYTHVGRAAGNEIALSYPSISNRHCIFIVSGSDIVLRDLNSSNGTYVNGEPVTEVVLRPADSIQVGVVEIKFEPGIKRPKLNSQPPPAPEGNLKQVPTGDVKVISRSTLKLPTQRPPSTPSPIPVDDKAYVSGQSAISYHHLAKPEPENSRSPVFVIVGVVVVLLALAAGAYYFFVVYKH